MMAIDLDYQLRAQVADIAPRARAVATLCETAMRLAAYGRSMNLSVHNLSRGEFDAHDGIERRCESEDGEREWWSKNVRLHDGVGYVEFYLYTDDAPTVDQVPEPNEAVA